MVNIAEEYMGFVDEVNDAKLLALASERMAMADSSQFVPAERLYEELGITQDDLDTVGDALFCAVYLHSTELSTSTASLRFR